MNDERVIIMLCLIVMGLSVAYLLRYYAEDATVCTYPHATEDELHARYGKLLKAQREAFKADVAEALREAMEVKS